MKVYLKIYKNLISIILPVCLIYSGTVSTYAFNSFLAVPGEREVSVTHEPLRDILKERKSLDRIQDLYKIMHEMEFLNFSLLLPLSLYAVYYAGIISRDEFFWNIKRIQENHVYAFMLDLLASHAPFFEELRNIPVLSSVIRTREDLDWFFQKEQVRMNDLGYLMAEAIENGKITTKVQYEKYWKIAKKEVFMSYAYLLMTAYKHGFLDKKPKMDDLLKRHEEFDAMNVYSHIVCTAVKKKFITKKREYDKYFKRILYEDKIVYSARMLEIGIDKGFIKTQKEYEEWLKKIHKIDHTNYLKNDYAHFTLFFKAYKAGFRDKPPVFKTYLKHHKDWASQFELFIRFAIDEGIITDQKEFYDCLKYLKHRGEKSEKLKTIAILIIYAYKKGILKEKPDIAYYLNELHPDKITIQHKPDPGKRDEDSLNDMEYGYKKYLQKMEYAYRYYLIVLIAAQSADLYMKEDSPLISKLQGIVQKENLSPRYVSAVYDLQNRFGFDDHVFNQLMEHARNVLKEIKKQLQLPTRRIQVRRIFSFMGFAFPYKVWVPEYNAHFDLYEFESELLPAIANMLLISENFCGTVLDTYLYQKGNLPFFKEICRVFARVDSSTIKQMRTWYALQDTKFMEGRIFLFEMISYMKLYRAFYLRFDELITDLFGSFGDEKLIFGRLSSKIVSVIVRILDIRDGHDVRRRWGRKFLSMALSKNEGITVNGSGIFHVVRYEKRKKKSKIYISLIHHPEAKKNDINELVERVRTNIFRTESLRFVEHVHTETYDVFYLEHIQDKKKKKEADIQKLLTATLLLPEDVEKVHAKKKKVKTTKKKTHKAVKRSN